MDCIIPFVSCPHFVSFYDLMTQVLDVFTTQDRKLAVTVLLRVMASWPEAKPSKQIAFINMIGFLTERLTAEAFGRACALVFKLYAACALSYHAKVLDASFQIWQNVKIIPMVLDETRVAFPIMNQPLNRVMKDHWSVKAQNALKSMHDIDPFVFDDLAQASKKGGRPVSQGRPRQPPRSRKTGPQSPARRGASTGRSTSRGRSPTYRSGSALRF